MVSKACIAGRYQRKLEEIARLGVELTVVVPPGWHDERGWMPLERGFTAGYELCVTPMRFNGSFHLHYYPHLGKIIADARPELIHIDEEPYNLATWHAVRLALLSGVRPIFFTWQNLRRHYPPPFSWIERYVYAHCPHAIAGNAEAVAVLRAKGYGGPIAVIPQFGVDPELFERAMPPGTEPFIIGYVGRLVAEKGIDDLLRAAAGLKGGWQIRVLGNGPERERLIALCQSLRIADHVQWLPQVPTAQVPAHLRQLHALVLPSRTQPNWKEQFGRVLIEAMACGVPVVGSDSGEISNVIGDAGLIFPEGDADALRAHLQRLLTDDTLWQTLSQCGYRRALERFTQAQVARDTVDVYRAVLNPAS